jgi:large subunit ribosomal protein L4
MARLGNKKSPMLRGGGVAFGPKPRSFATDLQRKVYDMAWRMAISYRYRKGELLILDNELSLPEEKTGRFLNNVLERNHWGSANGRSLLITQLDRDEEPHLFEEMATIGEHAELKRSDEVDVKDLLQFGRVIVERKALREIFQEHRADLTGHEKTPDTLGKLL